jgi:hypothetical protein
MCNRTSDQSTHDGEIHVHLHNGGALLKEQGVLTRFHNQNEMVVKYGSSWWKRTFGKKTKG